MARNFFGPMGVRSTPDMAQGEPQPTGKPKKKSLESIAQSYRVPANILKAYELEGQDPEQAAASLAAGLKEGKTFEDLVPRALQVRSNDIADAMEGIEAKGGMGNAFMAGVDNIQTGLASALEGIGKSTGIESLENYGRESADFNNAQAESRSRGLTGLYDVDGLGGGASYVTETLAQQAPQLAGTLGPMAIGAGIGSMVAPGPGTALGAGLGAGVGLAGNFLQMAGFNRERQKEANPGQEVDELAAFGTAVPQAALDTLADAALVTPLGALGLAGRAASTGSRASRAAKGAAAGALVEAPTEAAQQAMERAQAGLSVTGDGAGREYIESAVAGGLVGGAVGGARGALSRQYQPETDPQAETDLTQPLALPSPANGGTIFGSGGTNTDPGGDGSATGQDGDGPETPPGAGPSPSDETVTPPTTSASDPIPPRVPGKLAQAAMPAGPAPQKIDLNVDPDSLGIEQAMGLLETVDARISSSPRPSKKALDLQARLRQRIMREIEGGNSNAENRSDTNVYEQKNDDEGRQLGLIPDRDDADTAPMGAEGFDPAGDGFNAELDAMQTAQFAPKPAEKPKAFEFEGADESQIEAIGASAFANGSPRILPKEIDPRDSVAGWAWYRGWDKANLAAPVPNSTADQSGDMTSKQRFDALRAEVKAKNEERDRIADELDRDQQPVRFNSDNGTTALVSKSTYGKGWRVTYADGNGPSGHTDHETKRAAVRDALGQGYAPIDAPSAKPAVAEAAEATETNPTEAQKEAENYKTGKADWQGLKLSVENKKGSERSKKTPDGKTAWSVTMPAHYGRILRTTGADGDHVDFYMGDNEASQDVWVIDQMDAETGKFDEQKVMLGFNSAQEATDTYMAGFSDGKGRDRMGGVRKMKLDEFKAWLKDGDTTKPVTGKARQAAKSKPTERLQKRPFTYRIKAQTGGIDPDGPVGRELASRGLTYKNSPGLFKAGGVKDLDNLPASEWQDFAGVLATDDNGYLSQQFIIDSLEAEARGEPVQSETQSKLQEAADAKKAEDRERRRAEDGEASSIDDGAGEIQTGPVEYFDERDRMDDIDKEIRNVERELGVELSQKERASLTIRTAAYGGSIEDGIYAFLRDIETLEGANAIEEANDIPLFDNDTGRTEANSGRDPQGGRGDPSKSEVNEGSADAGRSARKAPKLGGRSKDVKIKEPVVLRDKETGKAVLETSDQAKLDALNTDKYEAVPVRQHLAELNDQQSKARKAAESSAGRGADYPNRKLNMRKAKADDPVDGIGDSSDRSLGSIALANAREGDDLPGVGKVHRVTEKQIQIEKPDGKIQRISEGSDKFYRLADDMGALIASSANLNRDRLGSLIDMIERDPALVYRNSVPALFDDPAEQTNRGKQQSSNILKPLSKPKPKVDAAPTKPKAEDNQNADWWANASRENDGKEARDVLEKARLGFDRVGRPWKDLREADQAKILDAKNQKPEPTYEPGADGKDQAIMPGMEGGKDQADAKKAQLAKLEYEAKMKQSKMRRLGGNDGDAGPLFAGGNDLFSQPSPTPKEEGRPKGLKGLTDAENAELAALEAELSAMLKGQLNSGLDPKLIEIAFKIGSLYVKSGRRQFADFIKTLMERAGLTLEQAQPVARNAYNQIRDDMELDGQDVSDMDTSQQILAQIKKMRDDTQPAQESDDAPSTSGDVEQGGGTRSGDGLGDASVSTAPTPDGRGSGSENGRASSERGRSGRNQRIPASDAAPLGEKGNSTGSTERSDAGRGASERGDDQRGGVDSKPGPDVEQGSTSLFEQSATDSTDLSARIEAQKAADKAAKPVVLADRDNIAETLPVLFESQHEDVLKAEARFQKENAFGMMFTNGTGTGKTFTGLGVVKRFALQGKTDTLIVAPSQGIMADWVESAKSLGLEVTPLKDTKDAGKGISITTYANLGDNVDLARRKFDLVLADESHTLMKSADASPTAALKHFRAITNHPAGKRDKAYMLEHEMHQKVLALRDEIDTNRKSDDERRWQANASLQPKFTKLYAEFEAKIKDHEARIATEPRSNVVFLSATPFAYDKNVDYAEGYLFDYPKVENRGGYNVAEGRDAFMVQNFGYRMRYNKLTRPEGEVNTAVMERQFHERLKAEGALSARVLDVDADYSRAFALIEDSSTQSMALGQRIDEAVDLLWEGEDGKYRNLHEFVTKRFDYLTRMRLLEAIKAEAAIDMIKADLALNRKVVVFHDYNTGGGIKIFDTTEMTDSLRDDYNAFRRENPWVEDLDFSGMASPIETLTAAFPQALEYNGTVSKKKREQAKRRFNVDNSENNIIIVQSAAGEAGISLHDTTGVHQRVLLNLGMPTRPTTAIQEEGRIYRVGQVTNAIFRYLNTGTTWERHTFAQRIAERASTAENLAMGEQARALKDSFIEAFGESDVVVPGDQEGTGGKARDRVDNSITPFERAKTFYYAQQRQQGRRNQREGADYFATPEPIGLKMVEMADLKPGEKVLEPSAGHGAIARFFPETANSTIVEPQLSLLSRAMLAQPNARSEQSRFEDLHIANKYDAIVMNPPFGSGGKTAMEHIAKAMKHLRNGGRIVALIPEGPSANKRYDAMMEGADAKDFFEVAEVKLPTATFGRAGTGVKTRIVVIEKHTDKEIAQTLNHQRRDYDGAQNVNELFDRIEDMAINARREPLTKDADVEVYEERGKVVLNGHKITYTPDTVKFTSKLGRPLFAAMAKEAETHGGFYERSIAAFEFDNMERRDDFLEAVRKGVKEPEAGPEGRTTFTAAQTTHAKKGIALYVASPDARVSSEEYARLRALASANSGYYSKFAKNGAIPGFQFESAADRDAFIQAAQESGGAEMRAPNKKPVAALTGNELGEWSDIRDLGRKAERWYRENLSGTAAVNNETGWAVKFSTAGAKKTTGRKGEDLLKIVPALREIIEQAKLISTEPDNRSRNSIKNIHRMSASVSLAGVQKDVIVTVREATDGTYHYDLSRDVADGAKFMRPDRTTSVRMTESQRLDPAEEGYPVALNLEFAPSSVKSDPEFDEAASRDVTKALNAELAKSLPGQKVTVRYVRKLMSYLDGSDIMGRANPDGSIEVNAGMAGTASEAVGVLRHEIIHQLRSASLWNKPYGLFEAREWERLVAAAEREPAIVESVIDRYEGRGLTKAQMQEEMVAELYRLYMQNRDSYDRVGKILAKIEAFFTAVASALRGQGFVSAGQTMERIAAGEIGARGPQGPGPRGGQAAAEMRGILNALKPKRMARTFREAREAVRAFQGRDLVNGETGLVARVSRTTLDKMLSTSAVTKSTTPALHALSVANIDQLFSQAKRGWEKADRQNDSSITAIHRFFAEMETLDGKAALIKLTVKETARSNQTNPIYTIEAIDGVDASSATKWLMSAFRSETGPKISRPAEDVMRMAERVDAVNGRADGGMEMRAPDGLVRAKNKALTGFKDWRNVDQWVSSFITDRMVSESASTLALIPGRPLFAEMGKKLGAAARYLRHKEDMDALRNQWHVLTSEVADKWKDMQKKNPRANDELMDLMHRSTLSGIDPTKPDDWGKGDSLLKAAKESVSRLGDKAPDWAKEKVAQERKRREAYRTIKAMYDALPQEFRDFYTEVKDTYTNLADEYDAALMENIRNSARIAGKNADRVFRQIMQRIEDDELTGAERDEAIQKAEEDRDRAQARARQAAAGKAKSLRQIFEQQRLKGPYFPLARFGKYFVTVRDADGKMISFSKFEREAQQRAHVREMEAQYPEGKVSFGVVTSQDATPQVDPQFVAEVEAIVADANFDASVMDAIWQRYLQTLPDASIRTSKIHRKGREGFNKDALRAFAHHMFHGSHQLARLKYGQSLQEAVDDAREQAKASDDPNRSGALVDEMQRRLEWTLNPQNSSWVTAASSLSFVWYLGVSPAAAIVNLSQTTILGPGLMKARFRNVPTARIIKELGRASKDFMDGRGNMWSETWTAENSKRLTADEKRAMAEGYRRGTIDKTQAYDLASVAESGVEYNPTREKWMRRIGWAFHHTERVNREVTYLANYRLARESGQSHADATDTASDMTWKTHFSYANSDRARVMQTDYPKFFLQFRQFSVNMLYRIFRDAHQSLKGATAAERKEARTQLAGLTLSMMAHAGIKGVWGYGLLMGLMALFFPGDKDDIEDWLQDALLMEGDNLGVASWNFAMGAALNGLPGQVTGTSLVERIGMPNLWFREPNRDLEGTDLLQHYVNETLGPSFGIMFGVARGAGMVADGEYQRGVEALTPKFVRDVLKTGRFAAEGVTTMNGDPLVEDLNPWELLMQANGFTPAKVAERYDMNNRLKNREKRVLDERKGLHREVTDLLREGKPITEKVLRKIQDFNERFPEYPITGKSIRQSLRGRIRASERNEFGVSLNPKLNTRLRNELPAMLYN